MSQYFKFGNQVFNRVKILQAYVRPSRVWIRHPYVLYISSFILGKIKSNKIQGCYPPIYFSFNKSLKSAFASSFFV
jgi:hypothetical protein